MPDGAFVVPDPNLIFNGEFKRTGLDLVLSHEGHEFVVHDYFRGDKRAALASPDGAHLTGDVVSALTGHVQYAQAAPGATAAQVIGHVTKLVGSATAVRNGVSVILNNGDNVEKGDVVSTGADSTLGITFIDGTVFGLSSNARMVLNEMVYDPNGSSNSSLLSLVAGTITFVAGETAKHGDMKIDTPVATMGIRGTAVLTQINFVVPAGGGDPQPQASFQVLVEPNGTTGSYILFDKITLLPIATVNQAGQMIQISGGNVSISNALMSPDVQKLITDVFTLKFTDNNSNTKLTTNFTDTLTPISQEVVLKSAGGAVVTATFVNLNPQGSEAPGTSSPIVTRIPGQPIVQSLDSSGNVKTAFAVTEHAGSTGDTTPDTVSGRITFVDQNLGDRPTVSVSLAEAPNYVYKSAGQQDVTGTLTALQKQDIAATQIQISVVADGGNNNNGSAVWTYAIPDKVFDFLAAGETLTLTYMVRVDTNFTVSPESKFIPITITITGTNDKPVVTTSVPTITFEGGTSVPGGPLTSDVATSGTLSFDDVDLTDKHTVSVALTSATLPDGTVPPGPLAAFQSAMSVAIAAGADSTGDGTGTINWSLADLPVYLADFIPKGEVLTLVYTVTLTDSQGATAQQAITVTITGTDAPAVVWIATDKAGAPSGGFWKDAANWETGTVPTIDDDVIVITDQLHGLTPSYPVTIDAAAYAKSVTMNDFGGPPPVVINKSSLTVSGALNMSADSIFTNAAAGTMSVGGKAEVLGTSVLTNAGHLTLAGGGDFAGGTTITNSGTIELSGGTLKTLATIHNAGGTLKADAGTTLIVDTATVDGGTVTILGTLELDGTSLIENGALNNSGTVNIEGMAEFANESVSNTSSGTIKILANGWLTIDQGSVVTNAGNVTVDASGKLIVSSATISGAGTVTGNGEIDLAGDAVLSGGVLNNNATFKVSGTGNALDNESITNAGTIEVLAGGALVIDLGSTVDNSSGNVIVDGNAALTLDDAAISGGAIKGAGTIDVTGASKIDGGATVSISAVTADAELTLDGITVSGTVITYKSSIVLDGTVKLKDGATIKGASAASKGAITNAGTLEIAGAATLLNDVLANTGHLVKIDDGQTLTLSGTVISGGTINNYSGALGGAIDVTGNSTIDGNATLNQGAVTVENGVTLTLDDATVAGTAIANGGTVKVDASKKLTLSGASLTGGTLAVFGTVASSGTSTITNSSIANNGLIETIGGLLTLTATTSATIANAGKLQANGAEFDIDHQAVTNTGTLAAINDGTLKLTAMTVANTGGTVSIEAGSTLDLASATIDGGTVTVAGTLESTGTSAIDGADITNTGTITVTSGTLTIDLHAITNHNLIEAVTGGTLKLTTATITNAGATITVDGTSKLYLTDVSINGGSLTNAGNLYSVSGSNTITGGVTNTGAIEVEAGTLNLSGGITGIGTLIVDDGATLELGGADAQTVTFAGGANTLQLDATSHGFTGTITGEASTGGAFTVTGDADINSSKGNALDVTASGGTSGNRGDIVLTPTGVLTGATNGIVVTQNGTGDISLTATSDIKGLAGNGITLRASATGSGDITVSNLTGKATGTGANSVGVLVENLNSANGGDISITQLGGAVGGAYGIDALTRDDGDITIDAGGAITGGSVYGIRTRSYGSGGQTVTTEVGSVVSSGSSGIVAVNRATSIDGASDSTITVNAYGAINSGSSPNLAGNLPSGIEAGYTGATTGTNADADVNGAVVVNNHANITAAAGYGINAYNYGNGDVTVNSFVGTTISVSGSQSVGINAVALSGGTGDVTVALGENVTISGATSYGIRAYSLDQGDISVTLAKGDSITSGSSGIVAVNYATAIAAGVDSTISVEAHGTIHSGLTANNDGTTPGGIIAGYKPGGTGTFSSAVNGDVVVDSDAKITADAGYGIEAFTWGVGDLTVTTGQNSQISAAGTAIGAFDHGGGDVRVANDGSATGSVGLAAVATGGGDITIVNHGDITSTSLAGISVTQNEAGATGSTHITNSGSIVAPSGHAAIYIQENATGTATIDNSGTIGPDDASSVTSTTYAIVETGGHVNINNSRDINGNISVATASFNNEAGGTWTVAGTSVFGNASSIVNHGAINLHGGSISGVGLTIESDMDIDSWGTASISGTVTNAGTIQVHDGELTLFGSLSGTGSVTVDAGALLELKGTVTQTINLAGDGAALQIDTSTFGGSIAELSATDTIDLSTIKYGLGTSAVYVANADPSTGGVLTVTDADGNHIDLTLTGADYSNAHFAGSDDGTGHTLITLNADDDAPALDTAAATLTASFPERENATDDGTPNPAPAATGSIDFTDIDLTDRPTATVTEQTVTLLAADDTTNLTDSLTPDEIAALKDALTYQLAGKNNGTVTWSYSIADNKLDFLGEDQKVKVVSTITLDDGSGQTVAADVTVTICGKNDAPTVAAVTTGPLVDTAATDSFPDITGTLVGTDADHGETATLKYAVLDATNHAVATVEGHYGSLTVYDDGSYKYVPNAAAINALSEGNQTDTFTVQTTDTQGATGTASFTVNVTGANDAPVISYAAPNYLAFDGATVVSGAVSTQNTGNGGDGVSLQGWVNWSGKGDPGDAQMLFYNGSSSDAGFGVNSVVTGDGKLDLLILSGGISELDTGVLIDANQAHNIALTHVDGLFTLYVDGVVEYTTTGSVNSMPGPAGYNDFTEIGGVPTEDGAGLKDEGFQGSISDVSIWNIALTQAQVQANQTATLTGSESNLVGLFPLHDGSGATVANLASGGGNLTIHGNAAWIDVTPGGVAASVTETGAGQAVHGTLILADADATDHVSAALDHVSAYIDGVLQTDDVGGLSNADLLNYLTVQSSDILNGTATQAEFSWDFNSGSQAFDFLATGQTLSLQYTIAPNDGHVTGASAAVTINVAGSNDAPTLDDATLASVAGNDSDPSGSTISDLFTNKFADVDTGSSFKAIAVSADNATSDQGVWQYEIAGTDQWVDISGVSDSNALVLGADTLLRFVPANGFSGTPGTLDVHALDDTHGGDVSTSAPVSIDITSAGIGQGGTTPVSDQAASISIDVTVPPEVLAANDDPISNAAPPSATAGWVLNAENGHFYRIVPSEVTWDQANAAATADGAYLATVTSQHESDFIANMPGWGNVRYGVWSGGQSHDVDLQISSHWSWVTGPEAGSDFTYLAWRAGEPNGWGDETVSYMVIEDHGTDWNDVPPYFDNRAYIEEWGGQQGQTAFKENVGTTLTTAQLLANDTDSVGNPIAVTSVGDPSGHSDHGGTVSFDGNIISYKPAADYFGVDSFTYTISAGAETSTATVSFTVDQSPVIDTTSFEHTHDNESNTDTITGVSVSGSSAETYIVSAQTEGGDQGTSVSPSFGDHLSLGQVNSTIASVTYDPGASPPDNDRITLTVTDGFGASDTVNFIFNQSGSGPITLAGTGGKDVIFATESDDTLIGGAGKDQFVFAPTCEAVQHAVNDFETGLDKIDLRQFGSISSVGDLSATQQDGDTLLMLDNHETILLKNVVAGNLHASDFIFGTHVT